MKYAKLLAEDDNDRTWLKTTDVPLFREVCSVSKASKLLSRSKRQIYRHIHTGFITTAGKMLGEWLITVDSVKMLHANPLMVQPLPDKTQRFFPEYRIEDLNPGRDRIIIISRVLDQGGLDDIRWLIKRYGVQVIKSVIINEGERLLSKRAIRQWTVYFDIPYKSIKRAKRFKNTWEEKEYSQ